MLQNGQLSRYVLDRVRDVAIVEALDRGEFRAAVDLHVEDLIAEFAEKGLVLRFPDREAFLDFAASLWHPLISNRRIQDILQHIRDYLAQEKLLADGLDLKALELHFDGRNLRLAGATSVHSCEDLLH